MTFLNIAFLYALMSLSAILGSWLCWFGRTSKKMVAVFSPMRDARSGWQQETLQVFLLTGLSLLGLLFFPILDPSGILVSSWAMAFLVACVGIALSWSLLLGPMRFATRCGYDAFRPRLGSKTYRLRHKQLVIGRFFRPYWGWVPYPVSMYAIVAGVDFMLVVSNVISDYSLLDKLYVAVSALSRLTLEGLQQSSLSLAHLGIQMSSVCQKYVAAALIVSVYVLIEDFSLLRVTMQSASIDRLKVGAWVGLFTAAVTLIAVPTKYTELHRVILDDLAKLYGQLLTQSDLSSAMTIAGFMDDHDMTWILTRVAVGYGNFFAFLFVAASLTIFKSLSDRLGLRLMVGLVLPKFAEDLLHRFLQLIQFKLPAKPEELPK